MPYISGMLIITLRTVAEAGTDMSLLRAKSKQWKLRGRYLPPPRSIARCVIFIAAAIIFICCAAYS